jgi:hypothetical protein
MPDVVDLLDPVAQEALRYALHEDDQLGTYIGILEPETLAAMAVVGAHPAEQQDVAAAIMPPAALAQLDAYRLLEREDTGERVLWRLTETGRRLATVLAAAVEPPSEEQRRQAQERLRKLIEEGNADLEAER